MNASSWEELIFEWDWGVLVERVRSIGKASRGFGAQARWGGEACRYFKRGVANLSKNGEVGFMRWWKMAWGMAWAGQV